MRLSSFMVLAVILYFHFLHLTVHVLSPASPATLYLTTLQLTTLHLSWSYLRTLGLSLAIPYLTLLVDWVVERECWDPRSRRWLAGRYAARVGGSQVCLILMSIDLAVEECVVVADASLSAGPLGSTVLNVRCIVGICISSPAARKDGSIAVGARRIMVGTGRIVVGTGRMAVGAESIAVGTGRIAVGAGSIVLANNVVVLL